MRITSQRRSHSDGYWIYKGLCEVAKAIGRLAVSVNRLSLIGDTANPDKTPRQDRSEEPGGDT